MLYPWEQLYLGSCSQISNPCNAWPENNIHYTDQQQLQRVIAQPVNRPIMENVLLPITLSLPSGCHLISWDSGRTGACLSALCYCALSEAEFLIMPHMGTMFRGRPHISQQAKMREFCFTLQWNMEHRKHKRCYTNRNIQSHDQWK